MAGHSKFKNIMHRKGAQDKKRGKIFTRLVKEITIAVKEGGDDINSNPRLRLAIANAKAENMPKDNINRAIKKGSGEDGIDYTEIRYEGFGPGGVAIIVVSLTDNKNRTVSDIRTIFNKNGGTLGESGSVSFMFEKLGVLRYSKGDIDFDKLFEIAIEAGAEDVNETEDEIEITIDLKNYHQVAEKIIEETGNAQSNQIEYIALNKIDVKEDKVEKLIKLIDALEDNDDVQEVFFNGDF